MVPTSTHPLSSIFVLVDSAIGKISKPRKFATISGVKNSEYFYLILQLSPILNSFLYQDESTAQILRGEWKAKAKSLSKDYN